MHERFVCRSIPTTCLMRPRGDILEKALIAMSHSPVSYFLIHDPSSRRPSFSFSFSFHVSIVNFSNTLACSMGSTENATPDLNQKIIIVGAGVFGLSTALHLARRGYRDIHLYDYQPYHENSYACSSGCDAASCDENKFSGRRTGAPSCIKILRSKRCQNGDGGTNCSPPLLLSNYLLDLRRTSNSGTIAGISD